MRFPKSPRATFNIPQKGETRFREPLSCDDMKASEIHQ
jgi:hypothetical protein